MQSFKKGINLGDEMIQIKKQTETVFSLRWSFLIFACILGYSSFGILVNLSKVDHRLPYSSSFIFFLVEVFKLILSLTFYLFEKKQNVLPPISQSSFSPNFLYILSFLVPAIFYCVTNNLSVHLQMQMDPATYQVLCNLKIISTGVLYRLIMKRLLTTGQWLALFILFLSACLNGLGSIVAQQPISYTTNYITSYGFLILMVYVTMSGVAGVYNECILKQRTEMSLNLQNSLLYLYGIILNTAVWYFNKEDKAMPFEGFNMYTWIIVIVQSCVGLLVSMVMKHSNNIVKLFISAFSALLATVLSYFVLNIVVNWYFGASLILFIFSLSLYHQVIAC